MGEFDELIGRPIPERTPSAPDAAPDDTSHGSVPKLPRDTRSQRRAIKKYAIDNMKAEGCTCQNPFPKITFVDGDVVEEDVPEGAIRFNSMHQPVCPWIMRFSAESN